MKIETIITIVTYNSQDFILDCLDSVIKSDYKKWFLVVVDNNSQDGTTDKIERFKNESPYLNNDNFKLFNLEKNTGFAAAVNHGIFSILERANRSGEHVRYILLVNPDCIIEKGTLKNLVEIFSSTKHRIGAAGGLIFDYENNSVQNAGGKIAGNFITSHITNPPGDTYDVDYVSGALFITGTGLFKNLGGFDSGYRPVYFEELDYCLKLKRLGFGSVISKKAVARHFEGASVKKFSKNFYKYYHKNRIRCAILNSSVRYFFKTFLPEEIKWVKNVATRDQISAIVLSYFLNFLFLPYNLIIRLRDFFLVKNYKSS